MRRLYINEIVHEKPGVDCRATICFCHFSPTVHCEEMLKALHAEELQYYRTLKFEKRKESYLLGRYSAKRAVAAFMDESNLSKILIRQGIFNQPVIFYLNEKKIQVSITHCERLGAAVAFPETHPMAVDIEKINSNKNHVLETQMTEKEKELIRTFSVPYEEMLTLFWTVKESLSKTLRTGLTAQFHIYEVNKIEKKHDYVISYFENFYQYKALSFRLGDYVFSAVCPKKIDLKIDVAALNQIAER